MNNVKVDLIVILNIWIVINSFHVQNVLEGVVQTDVPLISIVIFIWNNVFLNVIVWVKIPMDFILINVMMIILVSLKCVKMNSIKH